MGLGTWLWIVTTVLGILFLWISFKMKDKASESFSNYAIAGKTLPFFLIFFTEFANIMGVGNFVGHAGKGYQFGLPWLAFVLGEQGSKIIFALVFAGFAGKFAYNTFIEMIDDLIVRDKVTRVLGAILASMIMIAWLGGQCKGFGNIFNVITGADPIPIVLLFSVIFIIYTTVGGYFSLVWMDFVLGLMVVVFGSIFYIYAFSPVHWSFSEIGSRLAALGKAEMWSFAGTDVASSLTKFITGCVGILAAQMYWQSCFAAKDSRTSRNGLLSSGIIALSMVMLSAFVGMVIYTMNQGLKPDDAMPWFMMNYVPTIVSVMIFMLILAAGMSSADSNLNSATVLITNDIVKVFKPDLTEKQLVAYVRYLTVIIGFLSAIVAIYSSSILSLFSKAYEMAGGGLVPLLLVGLLWKERSNEEFQMGRKNSRVTPWGARVGMVTGSVLTQISALGPNRMFIALGVSIVLIILVSLATATKINSNQVAAS
ncbi:MAG TPA: sodium:solute symporter family protein [Thermoanaerobacterales bacterium]|nr:sodium:solute symporter family protein [Thermoanaerobacterales bacterium]